MLCQVNSSDVFSYSSFMFQVVQEGWPDRKIRCIIQVWVMKVGKGQFWWLVSLSGSGMYWRRALL